MCKALFEFIGLFGFKWFEAFLPVYVAYLTWSILAGFVVISQVASLQIDRARVAWNDSTNVNLFLCSN